MKSIVLVGAGNISIHYINVLKSLPVTFEVIGRSKERAKDLSDKVGVEIFSGGVEGYFNQTDKVPDMAIVAVSIENLVTVTKELLNKGVKKILVEKPVSIYLDDIKNLESFSKKQGAEIFVGFNRRFYSSVTRGLELIEEDGGVQMLTFEFTEWSHTLEDKVKGPGIMSHWGLANSIHVIDMAYFLGGTPRVFQSFTSGTSAWHPSAMQFTGAGITERNVPFSYFADWQSAGRWGVEIMTSKRKLIYRPLENLQVQERGKLSIAMLQNNEEEFDLLYKPGFYLMIKSFIEDDYSRHCRLNELIEVFPKYQKMLGYRD